MSTLQPFHRQLMWMHLFISYLQSAISYTSISLSQSAVAALTLEPQLHRLHLFESSPHHTLNDWTYRSGVALQLLPSQSKYVRQGTFFRMMSQTTSAAAGSAEAASAAATTEGLPNTQSQHERPELVLSVRDYLHSTETANVNTSDTTNEASKVQLVLASTSPRRREIFDMMGLQNKYVVMPSPLNETQIQIKLRRDSNNSNNESNIDPILYTRTLAEQKAYAVAYEMLSKEQRLPTTERKRATHLMLGSDTIVAITDQETKVTMILEKPKDAYDATRMLHQLQNKSHVVYTGVALVRFQPSLVPPTTYTRKNEEEEEDIQIDNNEGYFCNNQHCTIQLVSSFVEMAIVHVSAMNDVDIQSYVATMEPMDKAGAYGIQGIGGQIVSKIDGDFFTVMGLPMHQTSRALATAILEIID